MIRGIYSSISSMITLQGKQSVITNNLANINTNGYKEEHLLTIPFKEIELVNNDNYKNGKPTLQDLGAMSFGVRTDDTITNHAQGLLRATENNTDFALQGKGFFQVQDAKGQNYYTRDGSFKVNSQGYLVTNAGYNVMGINQNTGNLEAINIGTMNEKITISANNTMSINGVNVYQFSIVDFNDYNQLDKAGNNVYKGENPTPANNFYVRQGYVEGSNVDPINVTTELMENVKAFQANQKIVQTMDSILAKLASEIGTVR